MNTYKEDQGVDEGHSSEYVLARSKVRDLIYKGAEKRTEGLSSAKSCRKNAAQPVVSFLFFVIFEMDRSCSDHLRHVWEAK